MTIKTEFELIIAVNNEELNNLQILDLNQLDSGNSEDSLTSSFVWDDDSSVGSASQESFEDNETSRLSPVICSSLAEHLRNLSVEDKTRQNGLGTSGTSDAADNDSVALAMGRGVRVRAAPRRI